MNIAVVGLFRASPPLRRFFVAFFQSQIGTGAAFVALPLVAYQRLHSSWAIALVLLGQFLPGIFLTPVFGSLADRYPRRRLVVSADLLRGGCFLALGLTSSFALTVVFAVLSGVGSAAFRPAVNAALPGLVNVKDRSRLTAIFYSCVNAGMMIGPVVAGGILLLTSASGVLIADAATFVVSAALLSRIELGPSIGETGRPARHEKRSSVWDETRAGIRAAARLSGVSLVLGVAGLVVFTSAMFNVIAPLLATGPLHAGSSGYSLLIALYGAGTLAGSSAIAHAGSDTAVLRKRWTFGIALSGITMASAALAPDLAVAMVSFLLIGVGEALLLGPEMRLVQEMVPESLLGRVFGLKDVLENAAFVLAFLCAGGMASWAGVRVTFLGAGLLTLTLAGVVRCARPLHSGAPVPVSTRKRLRLLIPSRSPTTS